MAEQQPGGEVHLIVRVEGHVQGVFYRRSAREKARELGIEVDPANLEDGSVRIEVRGPRDVVDRFVSWCRDGPPRAEVTRVIATEVS